MQGPHQNIRHLYWWEIPVACEWGEIQNQKSYLWYKPVAKFKLDFLIFDFLIFWWSHYTTLALLEFWGHRELHVNDQFCDYDNRSALCLPLIIPSTSAGSIWNLRLGALIWFGGSIFLISIFRYAKLNFNISAAIFLIIVCWYRV